MATRKRMNRSLPLMDMTEKLLTKKETEENPRLGMTCPPLLKKNYSPIRPQNLMRSNQKARILSFTKQVGLNERYNPALNETYFHQMYRIKDTLGEGSCGVVYKVVCRENNESYAIKISKKCFSDNASYDEVKLLEKIGEHPNIVKYYFAWEEKSRVFMQLELCALSLDTYSKTNHSITQDQLWDILVDMLNALAHLHDRGLIHLDVKPDNIMMSTSGIYKLGDFGLLYDITTDGQRGGKLKYDGSEGDAKYLAKEVLEGNFTPAADIFSLGITMLELATDVFLPINGPLWQRLRDGNHEDPCFASVPNKLKRIVCKMMAPRCSSRPKAKQILSSSLIKEVTSARSGNSRINYYEKWQLANLENIENTPVAVCLNSMPSRVAQSSPEHVNISDIIPADMRTGNVEDGTPCVTPPRKVSRVIIYNI